MLNGIRGCFFLATSKKWVQEDDEEVCAECVALYRISTDLDCWCGTEVVAMDGSGGVCVDATN